MVGNESSDVEADALQALLDAFPSTPLELIASAFIQARSDQDLAAEIISFSLNGIPSVEPPSNKTSSKPSNIPGIRNAASNVKFFHGAPQLSPRPHTVAPTRGPSPPTLEEYFPSSPKKNPWTDSLLQRMQRDLSLQNQQNSTCSDVEMQRGFSPDDFPSLERKLNAGKGQRMSSTALLQPLGSNNRSTSRATAAFGLASSARSRSHNEILTKASIDKDPANHLNQKSNEAVETSLLLTESEACLLSKLGDKFNLDIATLRDVLGYHKGDIQKSFDVLRQLNSSWSSVDQPHEEVSELGVLKQESSSFCENHKEVATNGNYIERKEIKDMAEEERCTTGEPADTLKTYLAFEKAILKHENSSMKWVVECLCNKYPRADMGALLDVLRATNFDFNDAEKMLQEAGLCESDPVSEERKDSDPVSEERKDPCQLAKAILESLFSKPQEDAFNDEDRHEKKNNRKKEQNAVDPLEMPKWKAVTSSELDTSEDEKAMGQRISNDVIEINEVVKGSETANSGKEGERSSYGDWDDYERHQASAKQHWKTMQSYLMAATAAYAASNFPKAEILTEKGNMHKQLSMEAKERANTYLLEIKNRQDESDFTLDLQEQRIPEALQLLRLHLKYFSSIPSCHTFTVLTGRFDNPRSGHKKNKEEVVGYLENKGYRWIEVSPFCLQVQMRKTDSSGMLKQDEFS